MSPKTTPETPVRIDSENAFREKVGLSGRDITLEWKKDQVLDTTEGALTRLRDELSGKESADDKRKTAETFLRSQEKKEAEKDLATQIGDEVSNGLKDKLVKSGVVVGALGAGTALAHAASEKVQETTGMKINFWSKVQSWAREELKSAENPLWKWILGLIVGKGIDDNKNEERKEGERQEKEEGAKKEQAETFIHYKGYEVIALHIFNKQQRKTFDGVWDAMSQAVKDTWNKDKVAAEKDLNQRARNIITSDTVKKKTFLELRSYQTNSSGINIAETRDEKGKQALVIALKALCAPENEIFIDKELKTIMPDWRTQPMGKVMVAIYRGWEYEKIDNIREKIKDIDITKIADIATKLPQILISKKGGGYEGIVGENIESLRSLGLTNTVIERVMFGNEHTITIDKYGTYIESHNFGDEKSTKFIEGLIVPGGFADKIGGILDQFGLSQYKKDFARDKMNIRSLLSLYILTKGQTDIDTMKKGTKTQLFLALSAMIVEKNPISAPTDQFLKFVETPTSPHVKEILELIGTGVNRTAYEGMFMSIGLGQDAIRAANEIREKNPTIFYGAIGAIGISVALAYYARVPFLVTAGAITILKTAALAAGVTFVGSKT